MISQRPTCNSFSAFPTASLFHSCGWAFLSLSSDSCSQSVILSRFSSYFSAWAMVLESWSSLVLAASRRKSQSDWIVCRVSSSCWESRDRLASSRIFELDSSSSRISGSRLEMSCWTPYRAYSTIGYNGTDPLKQHIMHFTWNTILL